MVGVDLVLLLRTAVGSLIPWARITHAHIPLGRYTRVMDMSQNAVDEDTSMLTGGLDALERRLFAAGHRADKEYTKWLRRG